MKKLLLLGALFIGCKTEPKQAPDAGKDKLPLVGTWKLLSGTLIEKGDTALTDYTKGASFIKIINDTHFAFFNHDLTNGKGSSPSYNSGGGRYTLTDSTYTEQLEYCTDRQWEGHTFPFTIMIQNDTLVQQGVEKIPAAGIDRLNIERYVRLKN